MPSSIPTTAPQKQRDIDLSPPTPARAGQPPNGPLVVLDGSPYLQEQKAGHRRRGLLLVSAGLIFCGILIIGGLAAFVLQLLGITRLPLWWTLLTAALLVSASWLAKLADRRRQSYESYRLGIEGEAKLVSLLQENLDGRWTLFRNLLLPAGHGDIDAVLAGPGGMFVLEVKARRGRCRVSGKRWAYASRGSWRPLDGNPGGQARRNASQLSQYLKQHGLDLWIEPRVVWAGPGKLVLNKPHNRVWKLDRPDYILKDIAEAKPLPDATLAQVTALLKELQSQALRKS